MATFAPSNTKPTAKPILLPRPAPSAGMGSHGLRFGTNRVASGAGSDVSFGMRVGGVTRPLRVMPIQLRFIEPRRSNGIALSRRVTGAHDADAATQRAMEFSAGFGNGNPQQWRELHRAALPTTATQRGLTLNTDVAQVRAMAEQLRFSVQ